MLKYVLVTWPISQKFMDRHDCFMCYAGREFDDPALDGAYFVPEDVYDYYCNGNVNAI